MIKFRSVSAASAAFLLGVTTFGVASGQTWKTASAPRLATVVNLDAPDLIPNRYIVTFGPHTPDDLIAKARISALGMGGHITATYTNGIHGFAVAIANARLGELRALAGVTLIEPDRYATLDDANLPARRMSSDATSRSTTRKIGPDLVQFNPPNWGLDRIDQRVLPLDTRYNYELDGTGVTAYVVDTGVTPQATEFGARLLPGVCFITDGSGDCGQPTNTTDVCRPHGTEMAGVIGSKTYGVAKNVFLKSVRVKNCTAGSDPLLSDLLSAVSYITGDSAAKKVVSFDAGVQVPSPTLDAAVQASMNAGVTYIANAGGNEAGEHQGDPCAYSPQYLWGVITVSASDMNDQIPTWTNQGHCVSMFAPGDAINSVHYDGSMYQRSSTSMAEAHVVGIAALFLQNTAFPSVAYAIIPAGIPNVFDVDNSGNTGVRRDTPNLLANGVMSDLPVAYSDSFPNNAHGVTHYYPNNCGSKVKAQHIFIGSLRSVGPAANTDFDLRLERRTTNNCNGPWVRASGSDSTAVWEDLTFTARKGWYRWAVTEYNDVGASYVLRTTPVPGS